MIDRYESLEEQLRKTSAESGQLDSATEVSDADMAKITRRANRELVFRDAMHLGFGHLLTTFLTLVAGIHRFFTNLKKEQAKHGQS